MISSLIPVSLLVSDILRLLSSGAILIPRPPLGPSRQDIRVTVSFDVSRGPPLELSASRPVTACLTISGPTLPHGHTPAWRYYLRGLPATDK